jgi:UDP-N-acetyl-D-glucosamine dehydrogenase
MPLFWVRKVGEALNERGRAVRGSNILVLGVAYKRDIDDIRESPALDIIRLLESQGATVKYHDPYVPSLTEDGRTRKAVRLDGEALDAADCVVIVTDHSVVDYGLVRTRARAIVDTRNVLGRKP